MRADDNDCLFSVSPRFVKRPTSKVAREKEDVELECSVYARPEAKVGWLKNGDHIKQNEYLQVVNGYVHNSLNNQFVL